MQHCYHQLPNGRLDDRSRPRLCGWIWSPRLPMPTATHRLARATLTLSLPAFLKNSIFCVCSSARAWASVHTLVWGCICVLCTWPMWACVSMCIFIGVCVYLYVSLCLCCMCAHVCACGCVCLHTSLCAVYVSECAHVLMCLCVYSHMSMHVSMCVLMCLHICLCTHMHKSPCMCHWVHCLHAFVHVFM